MSHIDRLYEELVKRFVTWAEGRGDIRAAIIIGSRARVVEPADEWADLDILLVTSDPEYYVKSAEWLVNMGVPLLTFIEPTSSGDELERRVLFESMLDVDFSIIPLAKAQQIAQKGMTPSEAADAFGRGMRVILDKDGMASQLQRMVSSVATVTPKPPSQGEFLQVANDFLYHAVFTAKHLKRGELWWAKMSADCYMQHLLLRMIEWHSRSMHGLNYDTWFRGRFLERWASPQVLKRMRLAFSHYDEADLKRGLLATLDLFRTVALETAEKLNYQYPVEADRQAKEWIAARFSEGGQPSEG